MSRVNVKVTHNFNLLKVRARLNRRVPYIINTALNTISDDISRGIEYGRDINGRRMKPLKPATIKQKRRKGYAKPRTALYATGTMQHTYISKRAKPGDNHGILSAPKARTKAIKDYPKGIGQLHHEGGENLPARPWFGISKTARGIIKRQKRNELRRALGKAWNML